MKSNSVILFLVLGLTLISYVTASCSPPIDSNYAKCVVQACYAGDVSGCPNVNPYFNYTRAIASAGGPPTSPFSVAYEAGLQAYTLSALPTTKRFYIQNGCYGPFSHPSTCSHILDTGVDSCSYSLCLNNAYTNGACGSYADAYRPSLGHVAYPSAGSTDLNCGDYTIPAPACFEDPKTCSYFGSASVFNARSPLRVDEAKMDYWIGVASTIPSTEYYQCQAGYVLRNVSGSSAGPFQDCAPDFKNQCEIQTLSPYPSGPASGQFCAGRGTCDVNWDTTNTKRAAALPDGSNNNVYLQCNCDSGYTPTSGAGVAYCSIAPCVDQWGASQLASSCVGHGSCNAETLGAAYTCLCTGGYGGEVCQWPPSAAAVAGPLGQPSQQQNIVFWYHGSTARGVTVLATASVGASYDLTHAFYSMRFADGSNNKTLTEPTSGVTTTLTIQPKCYVAATETPIAGSDVLLALYGSTSSATSLQIATGAQDVWVVGCLQPATGVNTDMDPCRLPFRRSGVSGSMQDICAPPLASEVATVTFAEISKVYCMIVPLTHWLATTGPAYTSGAMNNYFCWTAYGYSATASSSLAPTFSAFPTADKADVFCMFTDSSLLWTIMNAPNAHLEWFHVYKAMSAAGCA